MGDIRFLTSSDEHLSDHPPGYRKDDYRGEILGMLEWQGEQARKFNATAVLRGGDFFHIKAANKTTMRTIAMASRIHRRYPCLTYTIAGNHDLSNNDLDSIPGQPLGVLFGAEVFHPITEEIFESGSLKVRVVGVPYMTDLDIDGVQEIVKKKDENITIAVVHALAAMAPEEKIQSFFHERIFDYRDLIFNGCPDAYVFGHYHKDQGIIEHCGIKFINLGAISRGALTLENVERKPKISLMRITANGIDVEEVIVPHRDAADIFDFELKRHLMSFNTSIDDFVTQYIQQRDIMVSTSLDARKEQLANFPDDVRKLAFSLLEAAEEDKHHEI
jgi:DNA repair exonuclease SbcCD nuclease subunit